jgi:phytoene desaturase
MMNNKQNSREVVIVGGGLGGLSAGIHLRLAGFKVTILEANPLVGGRANQLRLDGFTFDTGPSLLNYPWVFEELFSAAGRNFTDYVQPIPVDPSVTFQWRDGTVFNLSSNLQNLMRECERIEPGSRPNLLAFLHDASIKYRMSFEKLVNRNEDNPLKWFSALTADEVSRLSIWRSLNGELGRFFHRRYIREAFGSYGMYLGGSPYDLPGLFSILAYGELAYGLWLPKGGIYGLVRGIEKLALELGVIIRTSSPVAKIVVENQQVTGVELRSGERLATSLVVSNVDVPTTQTELLTPRPAKVRTPRMTPGVMTFYWGIKGRVEGLGHHTIFLPEDFRRGFSELLDQKIIPVDLPFYIAVPSETDPDLAPEGDTAMFVLVPTPLLSQLPGLHSPEMVGLARQRVLDRLRDDGIVLDPSRIVAEKVYTPEDWRQQFGLYDGSAFGAAHTLFQVGPFRSRNYSSDIAGLYYAGASTTPGTGMPMVVLSGKLTAERILTRVQ